VLGLPRATVGRCDSLVFRTCVLEGLHTFGRYCTRHGQGEHAPCRLHGAAGAMRALSKAFDDQRIQASQVIGQAGRHTLA
jgi:hypothetical protein